MYIHIGCVDHAQKKFGSESRSYMFAVRDMSRDQGLHVE